MMVWTRHVSVVHSEGYKVHKTVSYGRYINDRHTTPCSGMLGHRRWYQSNGLTLRLEPS